jgi:hypothetical protein
MTGQMLPAHSRSQPYQTPANDEPRVSGREVGSAGLAAPDSVDNCADTGGGATGSVDGLARSEATAAIAEDQSGPQACDARRSDALAVPVISLAAAFLGKSRMDLACRLDRVLLYWRAPR